MDDRYIGLMSGTSMDAVDAVLVEFRDDNLALRAWLTQPIPAALRTRLLALGHGEHTDIETLSAADVAMGRLFAEAALRLLRENNMVAGAVRAIGCHGQTVYHRPEGEAPTSVQIGDPNLIAELSGITTVADFRRRDIAAGGQGAPLVPAFHQAVFRSDNEDRAVVNIGGIANLTALPRAGIEAVHGFDTGPGNALMDYWIHTHLGKALDKGGGWAASGRVHTTLLEALLDDAYFTQAPPKSTGREHFNPNWLTRVLRGMTTPIAPADVQATLCELTAASIARGLLEHAPATARVLICGGGAYNAHLIKRLAAWLAPRPVESSEAHGIAPKWVEGMAFAWLARQTLLGRPGNLPAVTGARHAVVLGGIYPGGK